MGKSLISVVLPAYNAEKTIAESIQSVLAQTYDYFELLVINDGSKDSTKKIIENFHDTRIKLIENVENKGLIYTLNRGVDLAKGEYIARMDADDICLPDRFEKQLQYIETNELDLIGCETIRIGEDGAIIVSRTNISYSPVIISRSLLFDNCIAHPTWFGRIDVFKELKGYRQFHSCEDYDFLLRAKKKGFKLGICDEPLLKYRVLGTSISQTNLLKQFLYKIYLQKNYNHIDSLTEEDARQFSLNYLDSNKSNNFLKCFKEYEDAVVCLKKGKVLKGMCKFVKSINASPLILNNVKNFFMLQFIRHFSLL